MIVNSIYLKNFRNYTNQSVNLTPGLNVLVGENAAGKTNMLESIYVSSLYSSPKTSKDKEMINFNKDSALTNLSYPLSVNPTPISNPNCSQNPLPAVTTYPFFNGGQPFGYYVLSDNFYNGNIENMTPFELLVWNTIRTKQLPDSGSLLTLYIRQYLNLSPMDAFYHIPIYLRLIDICIRSIARKPPTLGL